VTVLLEFFNLSGVQMLSQLRRIIHYSRNILKDSSINSEGFTKRTYLNILINRLHIFHINIIQVPLGKDNIRTLNIRTINLVTQNNYNFSLH